MLDPGPCQTCPLATGIFVTPNGVHHTCNPEDWAMCDLLYRTSQAVAAAEMRSRRSYAQWAACKTRRVVRLFRRGSRLLL